MQNNRQELEALWDRYCCRLLGFIRSRVDDEMEAEDILQEVFLRVHRNLCCPPLPEKLEPWIYQITRNLIIDHYRKRKELIEISESEPAEFDFPEEEPEAELASSLVEMIEELPEPYRQALLLTEYQGLSQKALAEQLGISFSGAKSRVQRARDKLRDMFLACCHFEMDRRGRIIEYYAVCGCCQSESDCQV
ncbi:MAG: RNA polymerase sigma factor SigZ [Chloroflexi bacterium]|nr:MAG: RNA polymerase sigma factor SigZ [Chloroflexota bacterium]